MRANMLSILVACVLCACGGTRPKEVAKGAWFELRTERFTVWTNGDPELATALIDDLERFHQVLRALTSAEEREAAPPLRIFLAKDRASFASLTQQGRDTYGLFRATLRGNFAIIDASALNVPDTVMASSRAILFHEYTHYVLSEAGARVPSWYNEGLAEYMSTTQFRDDGRYTVGCVPQYRAAWTEYLRWLPMSRVLEADNVGSLVSARSLTDSYAQAWYAVHYFYGDSARKRQLNEYLRLWAGGMSPSAATQQAFGMSTEQLDQLLQRYSKQPTFECMAVAPAKPFAAPQVRRTAMNDADAHLHVGDLLLATSGPTDAALEVLEEAARHAPFEPAVLLALARAHWLKAETGEDLPEELAKARGFLEQAQKRASASAEAFAIEGHLRRLQAASLAKAGEPFSDVLLAARKAYRAAIRADEAMAEAYVGLGATYLLADNGSQEAQVALEAAAFLLPLDTEIALMLAKIHIARESSLQAVPALEYVVRWSKSIEQRDAAKTALQELRDAAAAPGTASDGASATAATDAAPAPAVPTPPAAEAGAPEPDASKLGASRPGASKRRH